MADKNIIFRIGSELGPGGLASLKAGLDMVIQIGSKILDAVKALDEFQEMWEVANKKAVMMASQSSDSLIKMESLMKGYNQMMTANVDITDKQFATLAARATELSQATGRDANEAFLELIHTVSIGSERSLKQYGITLEGATTLTEKQTEAIKQLTEGYENFSAKADTTSDKLEKFWNNLKTTVDLEWSNIESNKTLATTLDGINTVWDQHNKLLAESPDTYDEYANSLDKLLDTFTMFGYGVENSLTAPFLDLSSAMQDVIDRGGKIPETIPGAGDQSMSGMAFAYRRGKWSAKAEAEKRARDMAEYEKALHKSYQTGEWMAGQSVPGTPEQSDQLSTISESGVYDPEQEFAQRRSYGWLAQKKEGGGEKYDAREEYNKYREQEQKALDEHASWMAQNFTFGDLNEEIQASIDAMSEYIDMEKTDAELRDEKITSIKAEVEQRMKDADIQREAMRELMSDEEYQRKVKQEWAEEDAARQDEEDLRREYVSERQLNFAAEWGSVWKDQYNKVSAGGMAARATMDLMHAGVAASVKAAIYGAKSLKEALRSAVEEVALNTCIEASFMALMETGRGIADAASYNYVAAAGHFAAAGEFAAVAVITGAIAGAAHAAAPRGAPSAATGAGPGSAYSGGGPSDYGNAPGYGENKEVTVTIDVKSDWFEAVVTENDKASYSGRRSFKSAA
jgi:hypothetical protein